LWSLVAIGQYQSLRQADALSTLRTLRERLSNDLGVDPSPRVQELEAAILNHSAVLAVPRRQRATELPVEATESAKEGKAAEPLVRPVALVGRTRALEALRAAVERVVSGRGSALTIPGEAGVGKTRLASAARDEARAKGVTVLVGRCHDGFIAPAYWPWLPVLRRLAALAEPAVPREVRALLDSDAAQRPPDEGAPVLRTYEAVGRMLGEVGRRQPLLTSWRICTGPTRRRCECSHTLPRPRRRCCSSVPVARRSRVGPMP